MTMPRLLLISLLLGLIPNALLAAARPKLTLDEFFNYVSYDSIKVSPDGRAVAITTDRADWNGNTFRTDLWLDRFDDHGGETLIQLTESGHDRNPEWSPDGRWIAFLSERKAPGAKKEEEDDDSKEEESAQLYLVSPAGGEAFPLTQGDEEVHAFAWAPDSQALYFATRQPWSKDQKDSYKKEWKDVKQYRAGERGDTVFRLDLSEATARHAADGTKASEDFDSNPDVTPGSRALANTPWHVQEMEISPDGRRLAFVTESVSERQEKIDEFEIYSLDLDNASPAVPPHAVTHNEAVEQDIHWAPDSKHIFFSVEVGSVEGKYMDTQNRLYWVDADTGATERWAKTFPGAVLQYSVAPAGGVIATGCLGTEVQLYFEASPRSAFEKQAGWAGTYEFVHSAQHSRQIAFLYSSLERPGEVYLADSIEKLSAARPITAFNHEFTERDLPEGKPYRWTAEDGTPVEGMLMYPPGKFEAKNLPMFVLIHGGPAGADGNHFEADWYQWDRLAATQGWLVFEPNYRGSIGYGDRFLEQIVPEIVSRPGKDILEGVDALVKDGIADPNRLAVGGYSYGGYMTNWLITQTTRFQAAVTGAGAVEHVANWGNDDTTFDDAYFLGGQPWEAAQRYHDEAAIFQINKVRTPTHIVAGADDIRVAVAEDYLLDHALHNLGVPSRLLIFPGEGHSLDKNPWHGKIKVREELKWLAKYGGMGVEQ
jgi:dipeptidyl aminopeptidase/acylaminoacyl peptidase